MRCPVCGQPPPHVNGQAITMPCDRCGEEVCPKRDCAKRIDDETIICVPCLELDEIDDQLAWYERGRRA